MSTELSDKDVGAPRDLFPSEPSILNPRVRFVLLTFSNIVFDTVNILYMHIIYVRLFMRLYCDPRMIDAFMKRSVDSSFRPHGNFHPLHICSVPHS